MIGRKSLVAALSAPISSSQAAPPGIVHGMSVAQKEG
jgi:hypothetical protein